MADLFFNIADQVELFNEFLAPGVVAEWRTYSKFFDMCKKDWKHVDVSGKFAKQRISLYGSQSFGARSDAGYPAASQGKAEKAIIYMKRAEMFSLGFDGMALEAARTRTGAAVDPVDFEKEEQYKEIADDISRQLVGDGSGRIAQCKGAGSNTDTLVIDSPYFAHPAKFLKPGRKIDVYKADHTTKEVDGVKITAVNYETDTLTLESNQTWTDDSWVFSEKAVTATEGNGLGEMMGLMGIISNADPPIPNAATGLQQLLVANYPAWKAQVFDHGGVEREIVEDLFVQAVMRLERFTTIDVILVSPGVYRAWFSLLASYKTLPNQKKMWGGWTGLPFYHAGREIPVVADEFVPDGCALLLSMNNLLLHILTPGMITWEQGTAGGILQKVADYNRFKAEGHFFGNLGTPLRPGFGIIKDIKEPS